MATPKMQRTRNPGIYKRGGRYVIVWRHKGRQRKEFFRTLAEAREAKARRQGGDRRKRPRMKLRDYAEDWIENYRGRTTRGFSESTRAEYRRDMEKNIVPYFGGDQLREIDPPDVRDWFLWMEGRGVSASSIRKAKIALSTMFATAKEDGVVKDNPVYGVRYVPSEAVPAPRTMQPLTLAALDRVMRALSPQWRLLFLLVAHTGVRAGEMLGLQWDDVHLGDDPRLTVDDQVYRGKRKALKTPNAKRTLPLSPEMARALSDWRSQTEFPADESPVFPSTVGTPINYSNLYNRVWIPARDAAGIPGDEYGAFHRLRKTLGTLVHGRADKTARQLADWLGHGDPAFSVRVYTGEMDDGLGKADFLDEAIPVEKWATDGQHANRKQPETDAGSNGEKRLSDAENGEQPQPSATA